MGGLNICHTNVLEFREYQSTFGEYFESLHKYLISGSVVPLIVEPNTPALYQLWSESQLIIHMVTADMLLF